VNILICKAQFRFDVIIGEIILLGTSIIIISQIEDFITKPIKSLMVSMVLKIGLGMYERVTISEVTIARSRVF